MNFKMAASQMNTRMDENFLYKEYPSKYDLKKFV